MTRNAILFFITTTIVAHAWPARAIEFQQGIDEATAKNDQRPMVIVFGAKWCGWCRKMAADTLTDAKVESIAAKFRWVKIDVDKQPEIAARFHIDGVPATIVVDRQGRLIGLHGGYLAPDKFVEFITTSLANPHPEELLADLLDRFVKSDSPQKQRETAERLVEQLARPDRVGRNEILAAVEKKGQSAWPILLELMSDRRLAVRAAAAGALRRGSRAELPFHPFAEPQVRRQQITDWKTWLSHP